MKESKAAFILTWLWLGKVATIVSRLSSLRHFSRVTARMNKHLGFKEMVVYCVI